MEFCRAGDEEFGKLVGHGVFTHENETSIYEDPEVLWSKIEELETEADVRTGWEFTMELPAIAGG